MGCAVTKSRNPGVISSNIKTGPTASSSGLYDEGSSAHFLERAHSIKDKGSAHGTSSGDSPDSGRGLKFPNSSQKSLENSTNTKQRLNNQESQDFSFKHSPESSIEKENEKKFSTSGNPSLFRKVDGNSFRRDRIKISNLNAITPHPVENNISGGQFADKEVTSPGLAAVSFVSVKEKENDAVRTPVKSEIDQAGLAFSFMNLRLSNVNQQNLFYAEDGNNEVNLIERTSQYFNLARSSAFGIKVNETEKTPEDQKKRAISLSESSVSSITCSSPGRNNLKVHKENRDNFSSAAGSLSMIDVQEEAKDKLMPISSAMVTTSTNIASHANVTSISNLCLDERKKTVLQKRFTTNLITLIKPASKSEDLELNASKSLNAVAKIKTSELRMRSKNKVFSSPNLDFKSNLLSLTRKQEDECSDAKLTLKREQTDETKAPNMPDRSIDLSNLDIPEDSSGPSPIAEFSLPNIPTGNTPKTLLLSNGNISFSRQVEGSTILDRTIFPLEDNITRMDLDKYSINFEINEKESLAESPQKIVRRQHRHLSNGSSFNYLSKAKSAILDTKINPTAIVPPKTKAENYHSRPKSFCEIDQDKNKDKDMSSPGTECYLSPNRIPTTSFTKLQQERSMTDLNKTNSFIETSRVDKSVDDEGQKKINQYLLIKDLGKGGFGKVKLAIHAENKSQYAVKIANKNRLKRKMLSKSKSAYTLLAKEVAIMKKMDHPNIVKLVEVIDDPSHDKLYIAMEFIKKGAVMSKNYWKHEMSRKNGTTTDDEGSVSARNNKLPEEKAKKYFRHLILALDYLHNTVGIIHRDIKPENLLIGADDCLKVSDFGISEILEGENDLLDTSAGTKLYLAPEAWKGKSFRGKPADIWAAGGTLYFLLTGRPPFQGLAADDIKKKILENEVMFPADIELSSGVKNLIKACLIKDPQERITLDEIMRNDWLTDNGRYPLENNFLVDLTPDEEELRRALTKISFMAIVYVTATLKKAHRAKLNVQRKKTQEIQLNESRK